MEILPVNNSPFERIKNTKNNSLVFIISEINEEMVKKLSLVLTLLVKNTTDNIVIFFNCPGGGVNSGITCYEILKANMKMLEVQSREMLFVNIGEVSSSALMPFVAINVNNRIALKSSGFLLHPTRTNRINGKLSYEELIEKAESVKKDENDYLQIVSNGMSIAMEHLASLMNKHVFLQAEDAKDIGLVSDIIENTDDIYYSQSYVI